MISGLSSNTLHRRCLTAVFLAVALLLCFLHLSSTNNFSFAYDMQGHMYYTRYVALNHELPAPDACWQCWHPPLYYLMAAPFYNFAQSVGLPHPMRAVRLLSLLCYAVFVYYSIRLLHEHIRSNKAYGCALALVLFWPLGFAKATLINNDIPLYAAQMAGIYYLSRWWRGLVSRHICNALLCSALAMSFKSSGLVLTGIIAAAIAARCLATPLPVRQVFTRSFVLTLTVTAALSSVFLLRSYLYYHTHGSAPDSLLVPNTSSLPEHTWIAHDSPEYYLTFDVINYFNNPFSYLQGEWLYFWNGVLKSALFGEHQWKHWHLANLLVWLETGMILYLAAGAARLLRHRVLRWQVHAISLFVIAILVALVALMVLRIRFPYICSEDFRYIFPVMPMMALLYGVLIEVHENAGDIHAARLGILAASAFSVCSIMFIIKQHA